MQYADLIGKGFVDGGRGPELFDCFGLFAELCNRRGLQLRHEDNPLGIEDKCKAILQAIERGEWRKIDGPKEGCAVTFRIIPPYITHIGMMLDADKFIHIRRATNVAIERLDSILWRSRVAGFYEHV